MNQLINVLISNLYHIELSASDNEFRIILFGVTFNTNMHFSLISQGIESVDVKRLIDADILSCHQLLLLHSKMVQHSKHPKYI